MDQINEILINGALQILAIIVGIIVTGVRSWVMAKVEELKTKRSKDELQIIESVAMSSVEYVEQVWKHIKGEEKLLGAIDKAQEELSKRGIEITDDQLHVFIEQAVKNMNDWNEVGK